MSAPLSANSGTSVLSISMTSGVLSWARAVLILMLMLSHSWIRTVTFAPVTFPKAALIAAVALSLTSPFISQPVSCPPP